MPGPGMMWHSLGKARFTPLMDILLFLKLLYWNLCYAMLLDDCCS